MAQHSPKNPSTLVFWNDLENDEKLKLCSLAAKGLWDHHMLPMAARSTEVGVVILGSHPSRIDDDLPVLLARAVGESPDTIRALLRELVDSGAGSIDDRGRIYNRRMVREEGIRKARSEAGKKGATATNAGRQKSGKGVGKQVGNDSGKEVGNVVGKTCDAEVTVSACDSEDILNWSASDGRQNLDEDSDESGGKTTPSSFFSLQASSDSTTTESVTTKGNGADAPDPVERLVASWNAAADVVNDELGHAEWPKVVKLTKDRRRRVKNLLRSYPIGDIEVALRRAMADKWARGETARPAEHADWQFNFDHFVKEKTITRFSEKPDGERPNPSSGQSTTATKYEALFDFGRTRPGG